MINNCMQERSLAFTLIGRETNNHNLTRATHTSGRPHRQVTKKEQVTQNKSNKKKLSVSIHIGRFRY